MYNWIQVLHRKLQTVSLNPDYYNILFVVALTCEDLVMEVQNILRSMKIAFFVMLIFKPLPLLNKESSWIAF